MICEKVFYPTPGDDSVHLTCYIREESPEMRSEPRDAMLVLPGGGYHVCSAREAEPIALEYLSYGINAFVLHYSVKENAVFPRPLIEAFKCVKFIKDNAERFNINPDRIFAVGFSAGGHLCACLGTFYNSTALLAEAGMTANDTRVCGTVLSYPVISAGTFAHRGSFMGILGTETPTDEELDSYSVEKHVTPDSVPAFIWHTFEDNVVPVENSLLMAKALRENSVPFEMHIFQKGVHGLALCNEITLSPHHDRFLNKEAEGWLDMSVKWMKKQ